MDLRAITLLLFTAAPALHAATIDCHKTFPDSSLTPLYNETVGHAIHAITVGGLKMFRDAAGEKNFVPTVNENLSSEKMVLDHAPADQVEHDFSTMTMNILDRILSTLGNSKDGLGPRWSPVERIAHKFHMWDLWITIKNKAWPAVLKNPPSDAMCSCLSSVEFNGVKDAVKWVAGHYRTGPRITLLNRPIPKLTDAATWQVWKDRLLHYYTPAALNDAAMYLYCVSQFW